MKKCTLQQCIYFATMHLVFKIGSLICAQCFLTMCGTFKKGAPGPIFGFYEAKSELPTLLRIGDEVGEGEGEGRRRDSG